jgi:LDH2 family malate/lactate/ureidoglycolate dehydrogenase
MWKLDKKIRKNINRVPQGWLIDSDGEATTDPAVMHAGTFENPGKAGALLPFGSYKGWGLSFFCELLGSSLIGASTIASKGVPKTVKRVNSMMAILIDPTVAQVIEPLFTHTTTLKICMPPIFTTQRSTQHSCIAILLTVSN